MLAALLVTAAYWPGYTGTAIQSGWVAMWLVLPVLVLKNDWPKFTWPHLAALCFLAYAFTTLRWSPEYFGEFGLMKLVVIGLAFWWGSQQESLLPVCRGIAIGLALSLPIAALQMLGYEPVMTVTVPPSGLFFNSALFAETSALVLVLLLSQRMWRWAPICLPGLVVTGARGPIVALMATAILYLCSSLTNRGKVLVFAGGLFIFMVALPWLVELRPSSVAQRLDLWSDTVRGLTLFGQGVGSYEATFPRFAHLIDLGQGRPQQAHNDVLQLFYEFGIMAILPIALFARALWVRDDLRYVIICFVVLGCFGFPFYSAASAFIAALVAGQLCTRLPAIRFARADSGSILHVGVQ